MEENRFPQSATLFKFCREALELRYEHGIKVIDQDVGALLNFDPADCSHWKKGKKSIKALNTLKTLAERLNTDERIIVDVASGLIDLEEAVLEYRGYGEFQLEGKTLETCKKNYYRNPSLYPQQTFEEVIDLELGKILKATESLLDQANVREAPIMLPEILQQIPHFKVEAKEGSIFSVEENENLTTVFHEGPFSKACFRFQTARQLYFHLLKSQHSAVAGFRKKPPEVENVQANLFALHLLIPTSLLAQVIADTDSKNDLVGQVSEKFWVAKTLANIRLCLQFA